ncbi:endo 1,5-alpha-arabinase [Aspergillus mulundensis]|uniref:Arabinan endo-1,5-alpha-L-arabinosidase n=1 Tax=Aspergillus mulundensis TaxID=1810919 RepID=A0A3D8SK98_9EURO|nr:putative arabinan endo-1,5-alpha-L-arabinosidase D [Aspergillus mulundensis]RDW86769.1 putative arabinan endo-1,5-alpha-L-arabinosidase D [Aspergillus mulundensis]
MVPLILLGLLLCLSLTSASPTTNSHISDTTHYPLPNEGHAVAHDPSILRYNNSLYHFRGGVHIPIFRAASLSGPWENIGTVLDGNSTVQKQNQRRPWAPMVTQWRDRVYCFYSISQNGKRNSAIGVASSESPEPGDWTDHGALINTGAGNGSDVYPYNVSNAIDPGFLADPDTGKPYLQYGSYWEGIFQVPLADDLLSVENATHPDADHLVALPNTKPKPIEGGFMSYRDPYYYTWFSHGQCCHFNTEGFPKKGNEYSIRVGRSTSVHGPFVDRDNKTLIDGGGSVVYGSSHGQVYAPGGQGILPGANDEPDVLYYHYHNASIGFAQGDARLGWNYLDYVGGWPVVRYAHPNLLSGSPIRDPAR